MDGQRFDDLSRLIGTGASRRRVIKGLAGGLLGLGGVTAVSRGVGAGVCVLTGESCVDGGSPCCGGVTWCVGVPRTCANPGSCVGEGGPCNTETGPACCGELVCNATDGAHGACAAAPACIEENGDCTETLSGCCENLECLTNFGGGFQFTCQTPPVLCTSEGQNCSEMDCCEGLFCNESNECEVEAGPTCADEGEDCAGDSGEGLDCCGVLFCKHAVGAAGVCVATCGETGDACNETLLCCEPDFVCNATSNTCEAAPTHCQVDEGCGTGEICCGQEGGGAICVEQECCGVTDDFHCGDDEVCTAQNTCEAAGPTCSVDADCNVAPAGADDDDDESAICCGGICITGIECCIDSENPNERCDEGEHCFEGVCVFACKGDADCDGATCCCLDGSCSSSCCEDTGGVDQLPSTGVGDGQGLSSLLGAGVLAAGAAYLAGKKLRDEQSAFSSQPSGVGED